MNTEGKVRYEKDEQVEEDERWKGKDEDAGQENEGKVLWALINQ